VFTFLSLRIAVSLEEGIGIYGLIGIIAAKSFEVLCFPIIIIFQLLNIRVKFPIVIIGFIIDCLFYGLLAERVFYLVRRKRKFPHVPTEK